MRRTVVAILLTAIGTWRVLAFKSSPLPRATPPISAIAPNSATAPNSTTPDPLGDAEGQPPAGSPPPSPRSSPPAQRPLSAARTVDGVVVRTRYGDVQVAVVFNGSRIVDVKALQLPFDRRRSQDISNQAAPLLHEEVLQAQSAQIDTIGGATYTSDGYAESLQSALDKANA
jgi:uncharacterized protein with FMN-binding domain